MYSSPRTTEKIEIGYHNGRIGYTMYFTDCTKEHYLFSIDTAKNLGRGLLMLVDEFKKREENANKMLSDVIEISESTQIKIINPKEDNKNA